jgi:hypothetical protein
LQSKHLNWQRKAKWQSGKLVCSWAIRMYQSPTCDSTLSFLSISYTSGLAEAAMVVRPNSYLHIKATTPNALWTEFWTLLLSLSGS